MAIVPIYPYSFDYAYEHGESGAWLKSVEASSACMKDIDKTVHDSYLGEYRYDLNTAAKTVIEAHGYERVNHVLAHILLNCESDGRYSRNNKDWARELGVAPDRHIYCDTHPAVLDGFIDTVRKVNRAVFLEVIGSHEQSRHLAERNRLTWFHNDFGEFRANPGVTDARLAARYGEIMVMKLAKEQKRKKAAKTEERPSAVRKLEAAKQTVKETSAKESPEKGARDKKPPSLERG